jgi:transposase-like protein
MVKGIEDRGKKYFTCDACGFGYNDRKTAQECQDWCSKHESCNLQITKNAVHFPK